LRGMVNKCEPLINVVTENKPKVLTSPGKADRLGPKGKGSGIGAPNSSIADGVPPGGEAEPNPRGYLHGTW
jgi:hypothetical protein